jgi:glyoxalase family protein
MEATMQHNGIHHVTAIAGPARRNHAFYTGTLGLRLVKKTVNFDDPKTYHFYFGDETGRPGSILTHFPWEHAAQGRVGPGETQETLLRVPEASLGYWTHRMLEKSVRHEPMEKRFGETFLPFYDEDGMRLALVGVPGLESETAWSNGVPAEHAVRGLHGVTLLLDDTAPTAAILTDVFGFTGSGREGAIERYRTDTVMGGVVDLRAAPGFPRGRQGRGSVHHIAFRAADDATQGEMVRRLAENHGIRTTEQKDRNYFRSVYFREPGHVLFEIATDSPGFAVDEPADALGRALKLPPFLEGRRGELEAVLPEVA